MDLDEVLNTVAEKTEKMTRLRGAVAVACLTDSGLKVICIPVNVGKKFRHENRFREKMPDLNLDSLEKEFLFFATEDAVITLGQLFFDMNHHSDEAEEDDCDDADLALSGNASCGYIIDACTAASIMISPMDQKFENLLIQKMMK